MWESLEQSHISVRKEGRYICITANTMQTLLRGAISRDCHSHVNVAFTLHTSKNFIQPLAFTALQKPVFLQLAYCHISTLKRIDLRLCTKVEGHKAFYSTSLLPSTLSFISKSNTFVFPNPPSISSRTPALSQPVYEAGSQAGTCKGGTGSRV